MNVKTVKTLSYASSIITAVILALAFFAHRNYLPAIIGLAAGFFAAYFIKKSISWGIYLVLITNYLLIMSGTFSITNKWFLLPAVISTLIFMDLSCFHETLTHTRKIVHEKQLILDHLKALGGITISGFVLMAIPFFITYHIGFWKMIIIAIVLIITLNKMIAVMANPKATHQGKTGAND